MRLVHQAKRAPQGSGLLRKNNLLGTLATRIEVTCAGVTELPSVKDARHC